MTNASITRKLFWLERPQKHYADQVRHPGGGHGVRGDGAVRAAHRQLGFGGARAAAGALTIILLLICIVIKVIINHKSKQK